MTSAMHDHTVVLNDAHCEAINRDWYKMHHLLFQHLGYRTDPEKGESVRWNFSMDPECAIRFPESAPVSHVKIRSNSPDIAEAMRGISLVTEPTYMGRAGETVAFSVSLSALRNRSETAGKYSFNLRDAATAMRSEHPEIDAKAALDKVHRETLFKKLLNTGLQVDPVLSSFTTRMLAIKMRRNVPVIHKAGIFATGTATVKDASQLHAALAAGVGRDKTYGFGLLTIKPIQEKMQ